MTDNASSTPDVATGTPDVASGTPDTATGSQNVSPTQKTGQRLRELHDNADKTPEEILDEQ